MHRLKSTKIPNEREKAIRKAQTRIARYSLGKMSTTLICRTISHERESLKPSEETNPRCTLSFTLPFRPHYTLRRSPVHASFYPMHLSTYTIERLYPSIIKYERPSNRQYGSSWRTSSAITHFHSTSTVSTPPYRVTSASLNPHDRQNTTKNSLSKLLYIVLSVRTY